MYVLTVPDKDGHRMIVNLAMFEGVMIEVTEVPTVIQKLDKDIIVDISLLTPLLR